MGGAPHAKTYMGWWGSLGKFLILKLHLEKVQFMLTTIKQVPQLKKVSLPMLSLHLLKIS